LSNRLRNVTDSQGDRGGRNPRALIRLDWVSLGLLVAALILAPLLTATFPTPPPPTFGGPDGMLGPFQNIGISLVALLIATATGIAIWREWRRPVAIGAVPGLAGSGLLLAIWATLSLVRTPTFYTGLNALMVLLAALAAGTLIARLCRDQRGAAVLVVGVMTAGTLVAALGINEYLTNWKQGVPLHRTYAGFINPDFAAGFLLLTLPVILAAFVAVDDKKTDRGVAGLAMGFLLVLQSVCLLLTGSRTGLVAAIVGLMAWLAFCAWTGATRGRSKRIGVAFGLFVLGALLASAPTRARLVAPAPPKTTQSKPAGSAAASSTFTTQSQSGQFRRYTWEATIKMIQANSLLGTGLGSYEIAYPRYTIAAATAHAHNSLLQWTSETGLPGALFLMAVFAAATAFAFNVLRIRRALISEQSGAEQIGAEQSVVEQRGEPEASKTADGSLSRALFAEPTLLIAGLLAALLASAVKTFMDSDWYIVPTALLLAATLGLLVGLARNAAPLAAQMPRPLSRELLVGGAVVTLFLLWRAGTTYVARLDLAHGMDEMAAREPQSSVDAFRGAIAADPYDIEPRLALAQVYQALGDTDHENATLEETVHIAPIGRVLYKLAQYDTRVGQLDKAIAAYEQAHDREPTNLQTLRRLAEAQAQAGKADDADATYRTMTDLENSPYGTVRANADEKIETDFAYAHVGLARSAASKAQWAEAATQYARAVDVMRLYWQRRNWLAYAILAQHNPAIRQELTALYHEALVGESDALRKQPGSTGKIDDIETELKRVEADTVKDQAAQAERNAAQSGGEGQ
jgi:O-antigen ligase/tetratricopeptide (TPR) repeat protein